MKKITQLLCVALIAALTLSSCGKSYKYETVPNDPLKARIYTLDNGLKVYLTVNKAEPRIQTYVTARVGGKNDPKETTGLAHYLEHLMFKGTKQFGTKDYATEQALLDEIENLYEVCRTKTDEAERKVLYAQIDSLSQEASKIAIPNEYDKLMSAIGSQGTNAFTSVDATSYVEDIPANQIETWAKIQSDRFADPIIRLFHTELETVYEEKNMSLTNDSRKSYEAMLSGLFPNHPYGQQTVLGTQDHLKNPSIRNIKKYYKTYYVANNMAVSMAGDLDPDKTIAIIDKYFGSLPTGDVPPLQTTTEEPITTPVIKEVWGNDAENIMIGFRLPGANATDIEVAEVVDYLMNNGKAGLIDLNLNQKQVVLDAGNYIYDMADGGAYILYGRPKQGQSLDEVKNLLLGQLALLRNGEFEDWLIEATINNFKMYEVRQLENNSSRARLFLDAFVNQLSWKDVVARLDRQSKLTKQDIVDFANKYFTDNNYVAVYKRTGEDKNIKKIDKPQITPIDPNRDDESEYLKAVKTISVTPIEPVFLDFDKDITKLTTTTNVPVLYKQNTENGLFELTYLFDMGSDNDKALGTAFTYLDYLGTSQYTPEEIKSEFYKIACSFNLYSASDRVYVTLNGLNENFDKALALLESLLADPQVNQAAFDNLVLDINKSRADAKLNQSRLFSMLVNYGIWGAKSSATNVLTAKELRELKPEQLTQRIKDLKQYKHRILYYGPQPADKLLDILSNTHAVAETLQEVPPPAVFTQAETPENKVLFVPYNSPQIRLSMLSKGVPFDRTMEPVRTLYNEYFSGSMNAIVFQEMREAKGLAYSASAFYQGVSKPDRSYFYYAFIATQNDKTADAISAYLEIINNMPESEKSFTLAKENLITTIRTERIIRSNVLWTYVGDLKMGYTYDSRKDRYAAYPKMTIDDVKKFQEQYVKGRPYTYCLLGDEKDSRLMDAAKQFGPIHKLSLEEIFGY
ncbi:MAG: insulinase family protein [Prevotellaceae bacterium]|jgi:predicted Zn-dependent peptidase|nr:insulinase family protein [Prevotellaceae bacterium]